MDERLGRLTELLDGGGDETVGTSVRLPSSVRDAAALAVELGLADSVTELTVRGIRDSLNAVVQRAILDAHYEDHPEVRPTLAEVALAAAELDGNPLAARPDIVERAAERLVETHPNASPDEVLIYAAGMLAAA